MGRPRKPTALKILDGDRKDRINLDEPKSPPGLGPPPDWLDDLARKAWSRIDGLMGEMKVATRADSEAATLYCQAYSTWLKASAQVVKDGMTIGVGADMKLHPLLKVINESHRQMARLLSQFGLTPSARSTLHIATKEEDDKLLTFLAGGRSGTDGKRGG